jgi:uncharacterized membrane protein
MLSVEPELRTTHRVLRILLTCALIILAIIGIIAATIRGIFYADLATRAEPARQEILQALNRIDPFALQRAEEVKKFDAPYSANPWMTWMHVVGGGIFLMFALFQFSARIRNRYIEFHRWSGRTLIFLGFVCSIAGLYFGWLMPYGGFIETVAITITAILFMGALTRAVIAIRKHQVTSHREWMIRALAVGIGISTVRVFMAAFDFFLTPLGISPKDVFNLGIWTGWSFTIVAAELWIRFTRSASRRNYGIV